eukprot:243805-Amorphochlora_amoeboformis.AAC.1
MELDHPLKPGKDSISHGKRDRPELTRLASEVIYKYPPQRRDFSFKFLTFTVWLGQADYVIRGTYTADTRDYEDHTFSGARVRFRLELTLGLCWYQRWFEGSEGRKGIGCEVTNVWKQKASVYIFARLIYMISQVVNAHSHIMYLSSPNRRYHARTDIAPGDNTSH